MALAALIIACETADGEREALRATLPLLGATLLEYQARQAARLGASQIVVLVARVPPPLLAALDRLRRDGLRIDVARNLPDAADRIHPDERLLLIGDGCLADLGLLRALAEGLPPTLLVVADQPERTGLERIDARARWAGAALLDGKALRKTAAMLGDWDAQSTLLRGAVQAGATRIDAEAGGTPPSILKNPSAMAQPERRLAAGGPRGGSRWPARWLLGPVAGVLARVLAPRRVEPLWLALAGSACCLAAAPLAWIGWLAPALALVLLSGPLAATAARLGSIRLATPRWSRPLRQARQVGAAAALAGAAAALAAGGQWGWWLAAGLTVGAVLALAAAERARPDIGNLALADLDGLAWLFLAGFVVRGAGGGVAAAAVYALASFAWGQARLARPSQDLPAV